MKKIIALFAAALALFASAQTNQNNMNLPDNSVKVEIKTTAGDMTIALYNDTPLHRDNFINLVREGYYDGLLFHRVIRDFMIQTGDPESRNAAPGKMLGSGNPGYMIDAEILCPTHFNRRGALAAARTGDNVNPERRSSGSQFYIVTGRKFNDNELNMMEQQLQHQKTQDILNRLVVENRDTIMSLRRNRDIAALQTLQEELIGKAQQEADQEPFKFTDEQRNAYTTVGGAPHLDGAYTVFGEVIDGMDTLDRIESAATDRNDRPIEDVRIISMKILE